MAEVTMNINKNTNLNATVMVEGTAAVYLSASVSMEGGSDSITQSIQDRALYQANKAAIREQISAFQEKVYEVQDAMAQE